MGMANAVVAERAECTPRERTDHQLVSAVRAGDDRAFEELYSRYQRRIAAYVCGMVKDYGRAEDITQDVFVSALRRMRQTERPIAFKPWIYEIAKNACIDAYRRTKRAEEVSYDADDRLSPSDHVRLVSTGPEPDAAVDAKLELDNLCGAFGGLSQSHHEILVLRELEGLSYKDIGERLGMSRPAVESTLFRARKRLGEEYDELASGKRCMRIQDIIADGGRIGRRDGQRLARHISHCQPCRRLAAGAGVELPVPVRRRVAARVAGLLPVPVFLRIRRGGDEAASAFGGGWMTHAPTFADAASSGWSKGAAGIAALVLAGAGVGVSTMAQSDKRDERGTGYRESAAQTQQRSGGDAGARGATPGGDVTTLGTRPGGRAGERDRDRSGARERVGDAGGSGAARAERGPGATGPAAGGGAQTQAPGTDGAQGGGSGGGGGGGAATLPDAQPPAAEAPQPPAVEQPQAPRVQIEVPSVEDTIEPVTDALPSINDTVRTIVPDAPELPEVEDVTGPVAETVDGLTGELLNP
jgi:RNA polymerase sigma factor (sigma-70 family)